MDNEGRTLFRFEYINDVDGETYVDWVWLHPGEIADYKSDMQTVKVRPATADEESLYDEAYADGYSIAALMEFESKYDGITFRLELPGGDLSAEFKQTKMFECAICAKHKDFDTEVATANGLYLGEVKDDKLWHVCFECAMIEVELDGIEVDFTEEGEAGS